LIWSAVPPRQPIEGGSRREAADQRSRYSHARNYHNAGLPSRGGETRNDHAYYQRGSGHAAHPTSGDLPCFVRANRSDHVPKLHQGTKDR
jgi:hypothetical protein